MKDETKTIDCIATEYREPAARAGVEMAPWESELRERLARCWQLANASRVNCAIRVIETGLLLREYRSSLPAVPEDLARTSHSGTSYISPRIHGHNQHTAHQARFNTRLASLGIPVSTAYRWIELAERVVSFCLRLESRQGVPFEIESGTSLISLSGAISAGASVVGQALQFRTSLLGFLEQKKLSEVANEVADGHAGIARLEHVANGTLFGGEGRFGRRDFVRYFALALRKALSHVGAKQPGESGDGRKGGHWAALMPKEQQQVRTVLDAFYSGLPDELVNYSVASSKSEADQRRKSNKQADPMAVHRIYAEISTESRQGIHEQRRMVEEG